MSYFTGSVVMGVTYGLGTSFFYHTYTCWASVVSFGMPLHSLCFCSLVEEHECCKHWRNDVWRLFSVIKITTWFFPIILFIYSFIMFLTLWDNWIKPPFSFLSLNATKCLPYLFQIHGHFFFSFILVKHTHKHTYINIYTHILLNKICSVCSMLLLCMFSWLTIWYKKLLCLLSCL